jgi:peptide chain release factor 1
MLEETVLLDQAEAVVRKYHLLTEKLSDPEVFSRLEEGIRLARERAACEETVAQYEVYQALRRQILEADAMRKDEATEPDLRALADAEWSELQGRKGEAEEVLRTLLIPPDPMADHNLFLEIRAGAGGNEAALFVAELLRMYTRYAEAKRWKIETMDLHETGIGGLKEVIISVEGKGAYAAFQYESGVHRVQRVPETESSGRIHTSTVTVAVVPEAEEVDIAINPNDLRIDTFCSSGAGGQSVNTTYSAVRITHLPTGVVVSCQDERSQIKNRSRAMRVLRSRLLQAEREKQEADIARDRKAQVGSGDRSEKIRTYNFKENRVTDHRINLSVYQLDQVLEGEIGPFIQALTAEAAKKKLQNIAS